MNAGAVTAFNEDKVVLDQVHLGMKHPSSPNIDLGLDVGAKQFRLHLSHAVKAENADGPDAQAPT